MAFGLTFGELRTGTKTIGRSDNPQSPLVSVVMPACRLRPNRLTQIAIESVLAQTVKDFEFVVVDDGSVDGLEEALRQYQRDDSRIVILRNEVNCGLPAARLNEGILLAKGKYLACMFEDDLWTPDALEKLLEVAGESEDCVVYGCVEAHRRLSNGTIRSRLLGDWDFNYALLKGGNKIPHCAVLHSRRLAGETGLYDPHILLRRVFDWDLWLRAGKVASFRRCRHVVGKVTEGHKECVGMTVAQDLALTFRYLMAERAPLLRPGVIDAYRVDSLDFLADLEEQHRVREDFIIPFYAQHPRVLEETDRKRALVSAARPNRVLVTKGEYSTAVDVHIGNFAAALGDRAHVPFFVPESCLASATRWNHDTLVLYRTVGDASTRYAHQARREGKAVLYLMDDNMLKFGTGYLAEEFPYLEPGRPSYNNVAAQVAAADAVLCYSPKIAEDCAKLNPRILTLRENIRRKHIQGATPPAGGKSTGRRLKYAILSGPARKRELHAL